MACTCAAPMRVHALTHRRSPRVFPCWHSALEMRLRPSVQRNWAALMRDDIPLLGALGITLGGVIVMELRTSGPTENPAQIAAPGHAVVASASGGGAEESGALIATALRRPVFNASRRPSGRRRWW